MLDNEFEPEYSAPPYTIVDRQVEVTSRITTVIMDGEVMEFTVGLSTVVNGIVLGKSPEETLYE